RGRATDRWRDGSLMQTRWRLAWPLILLGCGTQILVPGGEESAPPNMDASMPPPVDGSMPPPAEMPPPMPPPPGCPAGMGPMAEGCVRCLMVDVKAKGPTTTCLVCDPMPGAMGGCRPCHWDGLPVPLLCTLCPVDGGPMPDLCQMTLDQARPSL